MRLLIELHLHPRLVERVQQHEVLRRAFAGGRSGGWGVDRHGDRAKDSYPVFPCPFIAVQPRVVYGFTLHVIASIQRTNNIVKHPALTVGQESKMIALPPYFKTSP